MGLLITNKHIAARVRWHTKSTDILRPFSLLGSRLPKRQQANLSAHPPDGSERGCASPIRATRWSERSCETDICDIAGIL